jgi:uncharacterized repeat protein (TIGR03803 family)
MTLFTHSQQRESSIVRKRFLQGHSALMLVVGLVLVILATQSAQAQTFTVLLNFNGSDGAWPYPTLTLDNAGNLYGTAYQGGYPDSVGVAFEVNPDGTETVLHNFSTGNGDGYWPFAGLTRTANGNLYGTTYYGGTGCNGQGCGIVFELDSTGIETVLYRFMGGTADGCNPDGGVLRDGKGNLYGTTSQCGSSGYGTVWRLDTSGTETLLHNFTGGSKDGGNPGYGDLIRDRNGNLYGLASAGGSTNYGTVWKLTKSGRLTVLHSFTGKDGAYPGGLVRDATGTFYGTASSGGDTNCNPPSGCGTVWKVAESAKFTVLHTFLGNDGVAPYAGVSRDEKGNLYGTTYYGGSSGEGIVFELRKGGKLTMLHSFTCASDGCYPIGGVVLDKNGNLYGAAHYGGSSGAYGTVWKLTP